MWIEYAAMGLGTLMCCIATLYRDRSAMLVAGVACSVIFLGYWLYMGEHTASAIAATALCGTLIQIAVPNTLLKQTFWLRLSGMLGLACVCFMLTYEGLNDVLPLLAFTCARLGETMSRAKMVRGGFIGASCMWMGFAITINNPVTLAANVVILGVQLYAQARDSGVFTQRATLAFQSASE